MATSKPDLALVTCHFLPSTTRCHEKKEQLSTVKTERDEGCDYPFASKAKRIHPVSRAWKPNSTISKTSDRIPRCWKR